jgi:phosphoribosylanthranilate isomerase
VFIKICGITNEEDALLSVAMGADAIGFVFAPSKRQVIKEDVSHILRRIPPEIMTVGVFQDDAKESVAYIANSIGLNAVQLHGHESPSDTRWIKERVNFVIKAFPAGHPKVKDFSDYGADALLLDAPAPGSGEVFDWQLAEDVKDPSKLILSGGLTPENVAAGIKETKPWGVDVSSGVEKEPGIKDPAKVRAFINAARNFKFETFETSEKRPFDWNSED